MSKQTSIKTILKNTADNWPESDQDISPEILRIHRISAYLHSNLEQVLQPFSLQPAEFSVLETLRKGEIPYCLTPTELSTAMLFSSGGLTKVLNRMEKSLLITRIENPNDKRGKLVQLSKKGDKLINTIIINLHQQEQKKLNVLSDQEKAMLNNLLQKVIGVWE